MTYVRVTHTTQALACSTQREAEELRDHARAAWPSAHLDLVHLAMFPRDKWFVSVWNTATRRRDGYVWAY